MYKLLVNVVLVFIFLLGINACSSLKAKIVTADYFPIKEGSILQYSVVKTKHRFEYVKVRFEYSIKTLSSRELNGRKVTPFQYNNGNLIFISEDKNGVYYIAEQLSGDDGPSLAPVPKLIYSYPLRLGAVFRETWQSSLTENQYDVDIVYKVMDDYEDVEVPAGKFEKCIHIKGAGTSALPDGNIFSLELHDWLCPDVGNVKEILEESCTLKIDGYPDGGRQLTTLKLIH